jgi:hypothetical protein
MESTRTGRPVANQFVIIDDNANKMTFQSYNSMIVEIDWQNSIVTFGKDWNYSVTTSKYRNEFLAMYLPQIANTKKLKTLAQIVEAMDNKEVEYQIGAFIYTVRFQ